MSITNKQAQVLTGAYSLIRQTGLLNTGFGRKLFASAYFQYKRHFEDPFWALTRRFPELFQGGHILDVGANIGYTAQVFARAIQPGYKVYAFEPEPFNFKLLETLILSNGLSGQVVPIHAAVGEAEGEVELWLNERHHADHRVATPRFLTDKSNLSMISVPLISIDGFVRSQSITGISFIKIDVQGYELPVCLGMKETLLANDNAVVALEYSPEAMQELGFSGDNLIEWFERQGYQTYSITKKGLLERGLGGELARQGYIDVFFSRRALTRTQ
jgi:FkbM family methyltransferase